MAQDYAGAQGSNGAQLEDGIVGGFSAGSNAVDFQGGERGSEGTLFFADSKVKAMVRLPHAEEGQGVLVSLVPSAITLPTHLCSHFLLLNGADADDYPSSPIPQACKYEMVRKVFRDLCATEMLGCVCMCVCACAPPEAKQRAMNAACLCVILQLRCVKLNRRMSKAPGGARSVSLKAARLACVGIGTVI
eukprot:scaffold35330_cov24-Tisochrysis_lutea.AAC.1